ncbi:MAG: hypothetical protein JWN40_5339 [Phycisphaerales bacterium]|nr:hypothetical protein [Phycisphaerales bacterium]
MLRLAIIVLVIATGGCCPTNREMAALARHGGNFIPAGEGLFVNCPPVDRIWFEKGAVTDAVLSELSPLIIRLRPRALDLAFQPITDKSLSTLERIRTAGVKSIDVTGTPLDGTRRLWEPGS